MNFLDSNNLENLISCLANTYVDKQGKAVFELNTSQDLDKISIDDEFEHRAITFANLETFCNIFSKAKTTAVLPEGDKREARIFFWAMILEGDTYEWMQFEFDPKNSSLKGVEEFIEKAVYQSIPMTLAQAKKTGGNKKLGLEGRTVKDFHCTLIQRSSDDVSDHFDYHYLTEVKSLIRPYLQKIDEDFEESNYAKYANEKIEKAKENSIRLLSFLTRLAKLSISGLPKKKPYLDEAIQRVLYKSLVLGDPWKLIPGEQLEGKEKIEFEKLIKSKLRSECDDVERYYQYRKQESDKEKAERKLNAEKADTFKKAVVSQYTDDKIGAIVTRYRSAADSEVRDLEGKKEITAKSTSSKHHRSLKDAESNEPLSDYEKHVLTTCFCATSMWADTKVRTDFHKSKKKAS